MLAGLERGIINRAGRCVFPRLLFHTGLGADGGGLRASPAVVVGVVWIEVEFFAFVVIVGGLFEGLARLVADLVGRHFRVGEFVRVSDFINRAFAVLSYVLRFAELLILEDLLSLISRGRPHRKR